MHDLCSTHPMPYPALTVFKTAGRVLLVQRAAAVDLRKPLYCAVTHSPQLGLYAGTDVQVILGPDGRILVCNYRDLVLSVISRIKYRLTCLPQFLA